MIYLLRHGQTEFNLEGRYQGRTDSRLTERGLEQARAAGAFLAARVIAPAIWCSPSPRAMRTAAIIADAVGAETVVRESRLAELSLGAWDGLTRSEIEATCPGIRKQHPPRQWMFHAPQGERLKDVLDRLRAALDAACAHDGDLILVSHAITGRMLRGLHAGLPLQQALALDASQEMVFRLDRGGGIIPFQTGA